ncbi:MAG: phosphatase PAP2 family protein [Hydrogenophaga sp.]|jgi:membrane-associated phospholipid phosphatase|uniref:phosphatase PAP2 family protein n=1 Tax=Hydrogenophaga sp. TaxID=1904254 RepID=UPI0026152472|nr:phosphatase PAP2 family protein [Hydrogenophaga sp.]MCV0441098.1 phosphatase PAP2 family protein [Hydrogenophaga sp.]
MPPPSDRPWHRLLLRRFVTLWYLKAFGTMSFMVLFFMAYFWVLHNPQKTPLMVPTVWVDDLVAFVPAAFYAYVSLWVYVSLPSALLLQLRELLRYGLWTAAMCLLCLALFWVFPTQTPVPDIDWANHPQLAFMKGLDASGNALPSLHVASAVYSAVWLRHILRQVRAPAWVGWLSALQCAVIVWSTMAVRQHVFLDVLAGAVVGTVFGWLSLRGAPPDDPREHT